MFPTLSRCLPFEGEKQPTCARQGRLCQRVWARYYKRPLLPSTALGLARITLRASASPSPWVDLSAKGIRVAEAPPPLHCTGTEKTHSCLSKEHHISKQRNRADNKINNVEMVMRRLQVLGSTVAGLYPNVLAPPPWVSFLLVFHSEPHRSLLLLPFAHPCTHVCTHARIQNSLCSVPTTPMPRCPVNFVLLQSLQRWSLASSRARKWIQLNNACQPCSSLTVIILEQFTDVCST